MARVPFELAGSSVFLAVRVNGFGPRWFLLDTGSLGSVVEAATARALRLETAGSTVSTGAAGPASSTRLRHVTFDIGGARLADRPAVAIDLTAIAESIGRRVDGILGSDLFRRYVVAIDFEQRELALYEPEAFRPRVGAEVLPLLFHDEHPYVRASLRLLGGAEVAGDFVIDSGSNVAVILLPSFLDAQGLRASLPPLLGTAGQGVGGALDLPLGRAETLRLGRFALDRPLTGYPAQGRFARQGMAGNIGNAVLRRFRVVFDYSRSRMSLEPNGSFADPYDHDMSGLALVTRSPEFRARTVLRVREGSPAHEAGVRAGDAILAMDGRDASELPLAALRDAFRVPGRRLVLTVKRGERTFTATILTRRMI